VTKYGDASNFSSDSVTIRHKFEVLKLHCDQIGRNYDEIVKSSQIRAHLIEPGEDPERASAPYRGDHYSWERYKSEMLVGTIDQIRTEVERLREDGIDYIVMYVAKAAYEPDLVHYLSNEVVKHFS
jgi:hypothetical protein